MSFAHLQSDSQLLYLINIGEIFRAADTGDRRPGLSQHQGEAGKFNVQSCLTKPTPQSLSLDTLPEGLGHTFLRITETLRMLKGLIDCCT